MGSSATPSDPRPAPPRGAETVAALARGGALAAFLSRQRWFAAKDRGIARVEVVDAADVEGDRPFVLALIDVDGDRYHLPLALRAASDPAVAPPEREVGPVGDRVVYDAHWDPRFARWALEAMVTERRVPATAGVFAYRRASEAKPRGGEEDGDLTAAPLADEQSNTSVRLGRRFIFKSFRRPRPGSNPELEVSHFLTTRTSFPHAAGLVGWTDYAPGEGEPSTVALLQPFLENRGDAWRDTLTQLRRLGDALVQEPAPARQHRREHRLRELGGDLIEDMALLGTTTGELHAALAGDDSVPAFAPEPVTAEDVARWADRVRGDAERVRAELAPRGTAHAEPVRSAMARLRSALPQLPQRIADLELLLEARTWKIRVHGDYHLGQVLRTPGGFAVIDFEGEPARPLAERRAKQPALRDVAGMLRSFDYAARAAVAERPPTEAQALGRWVSDWTRLASSAFVRGYLGVITRSPHPLAPTSPDTLRRASAVFEIDKALYELHYELAHRPDWIPIPIAGLTRLLRPKRGE
jgi:trehalose synthase-fused probable maltokinase